MRLVRWTCIFIQTVLKEEPGNLLSLFGAIQSFCLSFTTVHEAVALYTMLKSLEGH
ncbi:DUF2363 domain-containing protein [archaeon]|nr:MAG: DUF2363 domain-containing protein [archaeon]